MAVELMSARMVAPYFGSSLYVWATVIGFTLLALAIGYFLGGVIADKYRGPDALLWVLLIASAFLLLMHLSASLLTIAFENISPRAAVVLVSAALILPPLMFLGMVPTFLIEGCPRRPIMPEAAPALCTQFRPPAASSRCRCSGFLSFRDTG